MAIRLNNLASLLGDTNRIEEAEPLMRRALEIFDTFRRQTGHEHPHFQQANENYQALQRAMGSNEPD
ncbi:MAG: tetratricopeptide repeat protein [Gemmatimonadetes bacterium]|nr:tetratricopeptide repeat protein [Gemmatimonadota bacterium]